jgi:hypothetical protein
LYSCCCWPTTSTLPRGFPLTLFDADNEVREWWASCPPLLPAAGSFNLAEADASVPLAAAPDAGHDDDDDVEGRCWRRRAMFLHLRAARTAAVTVKSTVTTPNSIARIGLSRGRDSFPASPRNKTRSSLF